MHITHRLSHIHTCMSTHHAYSHPHICIHTFTHTVCIVAEKGDCTAARTQVASCCTQALVQKVPSHEIQGMCAGCVCFVHHCTTYLHPTHAYLLMYIILPPASVCLSTTPRNPKTQYNEMKTVVRSHQAAQQHAAMSAAHQQTVHQTSAAAYPTPFNQHPPPGAAHMQAGMQGGGMQGGGMQGPSIQYQSPYSPAMTTHQQIPAGFPSGAHSSGMPNPYAMQQGTPQQMAAASPGSFTGGLHQQQFQASLQQQQVAMYANMAMQQQPQQMAQPPVYASNNNGPTITFNTGTPNVYQQQRQRR